jgi:hypothetical protein
MFRVAIKEGSNEKKIRKTRLTNFKLTLSISCPLLM